ncbi:MAG TPA: hypothetical protein VGE48_00350 [Candidatus Paceibacterota bacterium]
MQHSGGSIVEDTQYEGVIVSIDPERNFGFARSPNFPVDVYFRLDEGQRILFDPGRNEIIGCIDAQPETPIEVQKVIVFRAKEVDKKLRATHWGMKRDFVHACRAAGIKPRNS